jgi:H/ACA ribonucleoprotein complex subunit 4
MPPIKSAVKRQWRYRKIYYLQVLEIDGQDVLIKVGCQAGTYIRKLAHDIGQKLKVGAHMQQLRRTKAAGFGEDSLCTLQDLTDAYHYYKKGNDTYLRKLIMPLEKGVDHLLKVWVLDSCVDSLTHGAQLKVPGVASVSDHMQVGDPVAIMTLKNELVAFGRSKMTSREMVNGEKGIAVILERVFLHRGIYPKVEKEMEVVPDVVVSSDGASK